MEKTKERVLSALNHKLPDRVPVDFGGSFVTGMHVSCIEKLRDYFGLEKKLIKLIEPCQCLGYMDEDLLEKLFVDTQAVLPWKNKFGTENKDWIEWRAPWGQTVLVPEQLKLVETKDGGFLVFSQGDTSVAACARMTKEGFFFDAINRQEPLADDDEQILDDNLEEFGIIDDNNLNNIKKT